MDQIQVTLPDGNVKQLPKGTTPLEIAKAISPRLADAALVAKVRAMNGHGALEKTGIFSNSVDPDENGDLLYDLRRPLEQDVSLEILTEGRPSYYVNLGPHPPRLWPEDLDRLHDLWLDLQNDFGSRLHHRDVVGVALRRLEKDLESQRRPEALSDINTELRHD